MADPGQTTASLPESREHSKLRIMHLIKHCQHGHGNAHVAVDLACVQARRGHEVLFVSAGGTYEPTLRASGVTHVRIVQNERKPTTVLNAVRQTLRMAQRHQSDVLHAHMMSGAIVGYAVTTILRKPLVTTVHNSFERHSFLMRLGHRVVAVSEAERQLLIGRGYNPERVDVVINGPNHSAREQTNGTAIDLLVQRPCIATVCGLHRRKGVFDVITAFDAASRDLPQWRLYIAGDGPDRNALESLVAKRGLKDRVIFLGEIPVSRQLLVQSDIFVLASYADPCSLAVAEARCAGCAIVATAVGGTPELLEFGRAGRLTPPGDTSQLAVQLQSLMTNEVERCALRTAALSGAEYFDVERAASDYDSVYRRALRNRSSR